MVEEHKRNRLLMIEAMLAIGALIFFSAIIVDRFLPSATVPVGDSKSPQIVGFVPVEIMSQPIDLVATESRSFILFTDREQLFNLTSLRISGEVIGSGRAEIVLENGLGQELWTYSNIKQKQGNMITGMAVNEEDNNLPTEKDELKNQTWLIITPGDAIAENPEKQLTDGRETVTGKFQNSCTDTCYMNMKMQKGLYYTLKIRVDAGTQVNINELKYTIDV